MNKDIELNNLTATGFLNEINKKREELISKNLIKKTNSTAISENEQPYKIPEEWLWVRLGDIGEIASSKRVHQAQWREEGIPFIRARDIVKLNSNEEYNPELFIEEELYNEFKDKFGVPKINDILITGVGTIGESYIIKDNNPFYFKDGNIIWFKNHFSLEPKFIKYYLDFPKTKLMIQNMSGGTTVATYTISGANSTPIPLPRLKEQQKIAEILSSVDAAIEKTEQVIAKVEEVKKGLMQQLLTKGIGHTEFKQTEIGEIPVDWEVKSLVQVAALTMGQSPSSEDCNEDGEGLVFFQGCSEFGDKYPTPKKYCTNPRKRALKGDILISVRAPVGDLNITNIECGIGRGLAAINPINIDRDYLFYYFKLYKDQWERVQQGSTFSAINKNDLETVLVPYPPKDEQMLIVSKLLTLDNKLEIEIQQLDSLQILKQGLMQQLLTGQVRVKID